MNGRELGVIFVTKQALPHPRQNPHLLRRRDVLRSRLRCWRNPGRLRLLGRLDDLLHSLEENAKPAVMLKVVECEYVYYGCTVHSHDADADPAVRLPGGLLMDVLQLNAEPFLLQRLEEWRYARGVVVPTASVHVGAVRQ